MSENSSLSGGATRSDRRDSPARKQSRVYVGRLAGTSVFDPLGDAVGKVRDAVLTQRSGTQPPSVVGFVIEVAGRRRIFVPITRVTAIDPGQVITTGLLNMRRFEKRSTETLVMAELLDRQVTLIDDGGRASIEDVAIEPGQRREWTVTRLFVRRQQGGLSARFGRRGESLQVPYAKVTGVFANRGEQSAERVVADLEALKPADAAELFHEMDTKRRSEVAGGLSNERLAEVLEELPEDIRVEMVTEMDVERAADVLDEMDPDDAADLVRELPDQVAHELLERMEPEEAKDVRRLLAYDDYVAGGMMTTEPVILGPEDHVADALAAIRDEDLPPALAAAVYVCRTPHETPTGRFIGTVHFQHLLRRPPHEQIGTLIDEHEKLTVEPEAPLGDITRILAQYNLVAVPVTDKDQRLLGVVTVDDVLDHVLPEDWRDHAAVIPSNIQMTWPGVGQHEQGRVGSDARVARRSGRHPGAAS
ncbi:magnesium transporter [Micrococcales bacterium 31B]|nr:magnesium transporter [Micrococcales bacterium 31B]